jgi:2-isopropylmalate synthase
MLDDETLRDGLQSPSVTDPPVETKLAILHLMDRLGIETADVGLPGAGERQVEAVTALCREIDRARLRIRPNITQRTGVPIEACLFIGSSPIRQYAEAWDVDQILRHSTEAIRFAVREGLDVMYVTEDTVRSSPEHLRVLLTAAVDAGAKRLCLCDTVGAAVPDGVRNLVRWVVRLLEDLGVADRVGIDWHGHRDRGLDVANTLAAIEAGATRVHGTALGVGERVGNTPMESLLLNLKLLGLRDDDLTCLPEYCETVSRAVDVPIPVNMPIIGRDGVPASWIGRAQEIEIGPMSGKSNVVHYLRTRGLPEGEDVLEAVLGAAKRSQKVLTEDEVLDVVRGVGAATG